MCKTWCLIILLLEYSNVILSDPKFRWIPVARLQNGKSLSSLAPSTLCHPSNACYNFSRPCCCKIFCDHIALLIFNLGATREWLVKATPRRLYPRGMTSVSIAEETGWTSGLLRAGMENIPHNPGPPNRWSRTFSVKAFP